MSAQQRLIGAITSVLTQPWTGLRTDLALYPAIDGYVLEEPLTGALYELDQDEAQFVRQLASNEDKGLAGFLAEYLNAPSLSPQQIRGLLSNLQQQGLCVGAQTPASGTGWSPFFKIPLWRPQAFLKRQTPWLQATPWRTVWAAVCVLGLLVALLILPQLDLYLSTLNYLTTPTGFLTLLLTVTLLKCGHEMAHALTAAYYGVPVRRMGVMMLIIWPLLYTDVTDAWKLPSNKARVNIALAGIRFEMAIAVLAGACWLVLGDGLVKSLMFIVSGVALLGTLVINLNPLMRFDGYYALMDYWGVSNLNQRGSIALSQLQRKILWGVPASLSWPLIAYGFGAWLWRLLIAYSMTWVAYQVIGIGMVVPLVLYFGMGLIGRPMKNEMQYLKQTGVWKAPAAKRGWLILACLVLLLCMPWPQKETVAATLSAAERTHVVAPVAAELQKPLPAVGVSVAAQEVLVHLHDPSLNTQLDQARSQQVLLQKQLDSLQLTGLQGGQRATLKQELERATVQIQALEKKQQALSTRAAHNGAVLFRAEKLKVGDTVASGQRLLSVANPERSELDLYISQQQLKRWRGHPEKTTLKVVLPDGSVEKLEFEFAAAMPVWQASVPVALLDVANGPIASKGQRMYQPGSRAEPIGSWYRIRIPMQQPAHWLDMPVKVKVKLGSQSLMQRFINFLPRLFAS